MANLIRSLIENDKKELKRLDSIAKKVEAYADQMAALTDEQLQAKLLNSRQIPKRRNIRSITSGSFCSRPRSSKTCIGVISIPRTIDGWNRASRWKYP